MTEFLPQNISDDESDSDNDDIICTANQVRVENSTVEAKSEEKTTSVKKPMLKFTESFNQNALAHIIKNKEEFRNKIRVYDDDYDPFFLPERYLKKSTDGKFITSYKQSGEKAFGRFFANGGLSLQSFSREIRHSIAGDMYDDIDMVNAHPVILLHMCKQNGIVCDNLNRYVVDREKYISRIIKKNEDKDRDNVKKMILSLMNGGQSAYDKLQNKTSWLKEFKGEVDSIHNSICALKVEEFKEHSKTYTKKYNSKASFMNKLLCDFENNILMKIVEFYRVGVLDIAVLCFDGIMLPKGDDKRLEDCEKYIYEKLNIVIELKIKEMTEGFELGEIEEFDPNTFNWNITAHDIYDILHDDLLNESFSDETIAKAFTYCVKNDIVVVNNEGCGYQWNDKTLLWEEKTDKALMRNMPQMLDIYFIKIVAQMKKNVDEAETTELSKYWYQHHKNMNAYRKKLKSARGMKDAFFITSTDLLDVDFPLRLNINHSLIPTLNGQVVDLKTGIERSRTKEDMFSFECPVSLVEYNQTNCTNVDRFVNSIFCNNIELIQYMRERMGMFLTGDTVREFDVFHGEGRNGKSTLCKLLGDILGSGKFYNTLSDGIFIKNPKMSKAQCSEHTSHKIPLIGIRLGICQEIGKGAVINAEELKKLSASDPFKYRGAYEKKEKECIPFVKLILCINPGLELDVEDQAILDRVRYIPFYARFVDDPDSKNPREFKADKDFIDTMGTQTERNLFFSWLVGGAVAYYNRGRILITPQLVIDDKKKNIGDNDYIQRFLDEMYEIKADVDIKDKDVRDEWGVMLSSIQQKFNSWISENNLSDSSYTQLGVKLEKIGIKKHRTNRGYKMVGLRQHPDDENDE